MRHEQVAVGEPTFRLTEDQMKARLEQLERRIGGKGT